METDAEYCDRQNLYDISSMVGEAFNKGVPDAGSDETESEKEHMADDSIRDFHPRGPSSSDDEEAGGAPLQKTPTRFFSPRLQGQRKTVFLKFAFTNVLLAVLCFTIFVLFWGLFTILKNMCIR